MIKFGYHWPKYSGCSNGPVASVTRPPGKRLRFPCPPRSWIHTLRRVSWKRPHLMLCPLVDPLHWSWRSACSETLVILASKLQCPPHTYFTASLTTTASRKPPLTNPELEAQGARANTVLQPPPQVAEHCMPGEVRLAATWECVSPQQHDCASSCHPVGGGLSAELGICQCHEYVSAEELCDAQCLAQALQLSLAWGPSREPILGVKNEAGDSIQMDL
ncbi:hypothetical protein P7K49_029455 [Saguinus oedipus]|uniref:Uncharacterized protein n=1 Tax=Saguinus oedipus TaxID=9490 RepID=A0ABQ9U7A2_SAGOE|nr:hypothetical protein P7K49_029455 [Saguinus oedipus]